MRIRGVLLDFNGTMFFDGEMQEESWRIFLKKKTGRDVAEAEFHQYIYGRHADVTFRHYLGPQLSGLDVEALSEEKETHYRALCLADRDKFRLAEGLPQFLDLLQGRGIRYTIATASGINNLKFFFKYLDLARWFDIRRVVYDDGTFPGKPEKDIYLKAAAKIDVPIHQCMVFEDARAGILSAMRAGACKIVGVASTIPKEELACIDRVSAVIEDFWHAEDLLE